MLLFLKQSILYCCLVNFFCFLLYFNKSAWSFFYFLFCGCWNKLKILVVSRDILCVVFQKKKKVQQCIMFILWVIGLGGHRESSKKCLKNARCSICLTHEGNKQADKRAKSPAVPVCVSPCGCVQWTRQRTRQRRNLERWERISLMLTSPQLP